MAGTARPDAAALADLARRAKLSLRKPADAAVGKDQPDDMRAFLPAESKSSTRPESAARPALSVTSRRGHPPW
jgi:hypothetical protein